MFRFTLAIGLGTAMALGGLAVAGPAGAQAKEQVVFSGEGTGSVGEAEFWIWCAVDQSGQYDDCNGAMRFDDLKLARHVEGEVTELGDDVYQMDVTSTLDDSVACTLTNVPPITHGHTNTVDISCSSPSGTATSDDAVVVSTGH